MSETGPKATNDQIDPRRIEAICCALIDRFGPQACDVAERQIDEHDSDDARAIWIAVWDILCSPTARHA